MKSIGKTVNTGLYSIGFLFLSSAYAGTFTFMGSTDKNPLAYAAGEK